MLKVKTTIKPSLIPMAGIGLFSSQFIPKGTIVWEYDSAQDREYTIAQYNALNNIDKEFIDTYAFKFNGKLYICVDNARFFNHSNDPNCCSVDHSALNLGFTIAKRDIQPGEELTDNYLEFGLINEDQDWHKERIKTFVNV